MTHNSNGDGSHRKAGLGARGIPLRRHRTILFTDAEWEAVQEMARVHGKAPRVFVREISLGTLPLQKPRLAHAPLIRQLERGATALARLKATALATGASEQAAMLEAALSEVIKVFREGATQHRARARP